MTELYRLDPEVAGGWGPNTVVVNSEAVSAGREPMWQVERLEYRFDGWMGDELLACVPCFIVTTDLAQSLSNNSLSGVQLTDVLIAKSEMFDELSPGLQLPEFERLMPEGKVGIDDNAHVVYWSGHDVCLNRDSDLVVTRKALNVFQLHRIDYCSIITLHS